MEEPDISGKSSASGGSGSGRRSRFAHISSLVSSAAIFARNTYSYTREANETADSPSALSNAPDSSASSSSRSLLLLVSRGGAKSLGKRRSAAYATQCTGFSGVSRRVQMGWDLGAGLGAHSKHATRLHLCEVTWPRYPVVPDSTRGTSAAMHSRLTCLRASRLSRPLRTTSKRRKKETSNLSDLTFAWCAMTEASGRNLSTDSRATCG